jgi:hypothetical protein
VKTDKHIESDESTKKEEALAKKREKETYAGNEFEEMVAEMQRLAAVERSLAPEDFEKDVDANHHIDFITAGKSSFLICYSLLIFVHSCKSSQHSVRARNFGPLANEENCRANYPGHGDLDKRRVRVPGNIILICRLFSPVFLDWYRLK